MKTIWETIIGLEIHAQLNTKTKLFSPAPNQFGNEPNENISVICTGQPGSLPLLNEEALYKAVLFGLAVGASVEPCSFDRKSYFYPDTPKNFQITQFFHPILKGGRVPINIQGRTKEVTIQSAHLEEDAGSLRHFSKFSGVDDNRAGCALLEIVSDSCLRSPEEAVLYAKAVRAILQYTDVSRGNMEQGHLRVDANISVRPLGETTLRNKVEIKNMASFEALRKAIEQEKERQIQIYEANPAASIPSSTCRFDPTTQTLSVMREKESSGDYRYMPEPDIPPVSIPEEVISRLKKELPELPEKRRKRYQKELGLSEEASLLLTTDKHLSDYFEQVLPHCNSPKLACNWITIEFAGRLKEEGKTLLTADIAPQHVGQLIDLIERNVITARMAKSLADEMVQNPQKSPEKLVEGNPDYAPVANASTLDPIIEEVVASHPQSIADFRKGKTKAFSFLVGQVMKQTKGKADPATVNLLLHKKLDCKP